MRAKTLLLVFSLLLVVIFKINAQFSDILVTWNITVTDFNSSYGSAISFADFNGDGWDDLSIGSRDQIPKFFINDQGNGFIPVVLNIPGNVLNEINMILWADYDNDGDKDLLLSIENRNIQFYQNQGDLNLVNVTEEVGLSVENVPNYGAAWADINNDGLLDLYLCRYNSSPDVSYIYENRLFKQLPNGTFEDISLTASVSDGQKPSFQPLIWDYDLDGWQDIFIINDRAFHSNVMYRNLGDETFENTSTETGLEQIFDAMSVVHGDFDNDQDMDIFISNTIGNYLNRNNGDGTFTNVAAAAGVLGMVTCWGGVWLDYDNNGYQDLYVATAPLNNSSVPSFFYENNGDGTFDNITASMGLGGDNNANYAVAKGDFDRDGREDFLVGSRNAKARLYQNNTPAALDNHWVSLSFEGVVSNRDAIGTSMKVYCGDDVYTRYTLCGESFISQHSLNKHVGLGTHELVDSVVIKWPRGLEETHYNLPVDEFHHFVEGETLQANFPESPEAYFCPNESFELSIPQDDFVSIFWSNGSETFSFSTTEEGNYSASLVHESGIIVQTDTLNLSSYVPSNIEFTVNNPSCYNAQNGSFELAPSSDDVESLNWLNLGEGTAFEDLDAGYYFYEGQDINGCFIAGDIQLVEPEELIIGSFVSPILCFGDSNASVELSFSDFVLLEGITWSNGDQGILADSLSAGTYYYDVVAGLDCIYSGSISISEPEELLIEADYSAVLCHGEANGIAQLELSNEEIILDITWSNGDFGLSADSLSSGTHTYEIITEPNCWYSGSISISEPDELQAELNSTISNNPECPETYMLSLDLDGGVNPIHSVWTISSPGEEPINFENAMEWDCLSSGNVNVIITDNNGCTLQLNQDFEIIIGIDDLNPIEHLFYPNPNHGVLRFSSTLNGKEFQIFNSSGQLVKQGVLDRTELNINNLNSGFYTLSLLVDSKLKSIPFILE